MHDYLEPELGGMPRVPETQALLYCQLFGLLVAACQSASSDAVCISIMVTELMRLPLPAAMRAASREYFRGVLLGKFAI